MLFNKIDENQIFKANFGLEKESLRVTQDGYISKTLHPFDDNKNITRDFCENQVEIVTDVYPNVEELYNGLNSINDYVKDTLLNLEEPEYLWCFSNPPYFKSEDDIPVARFDNSLNYKQSYREYLAKKYGKRLMLYSGIHYNFSFDNDTLKSLYRYNNSISYNDFVSNIYLDLAKKLSKYSWLLVALTSASPIYDCSLIDDNFLGIDGFNGYASMRNSPAGYWNRFNLILDYSSLDNYVKSIQHYIDIGKIASVGECYIPIRLKPNGENSLDALKDGINHIELRMFDLNPLDNAGIKIEDLYFTHYLIIYLKYILPIKDNKHKYIGLEFEIPVVNLNKQPVDYNIIHDMTQSFSKYFDFSPLHLDDDGNPYSLQNETNGDNLSFDFCYSNLELSMGKENNLNVLNDRFIEYYTFIQDYLKPYNYTLTGMGINPYYKINTNTPIQSSRYQMLYNYLASYKNYTDKKIFQPYANYGAFTSASQVQLDVNQDNLIEVINTFNMLEPFKAVLFANSYIPEYPDLLCTRDMFWYDSMHGYNPHNVGIHECKLKDINDLIEYIKSCSMYCVERDNYYIFFEPIPVMKYFNVKSVDGKYYQNGSLHSISFKPQP